MCWRQWVLHPDLAAGAIRVSLGWNTTPEDIEQFICRLGDSLNRPGGKRHRKKNNGRYSTPSNSSRISTSTSTNTVSPPTSNPTWRPRASTRTSSPSSRTRKASPPGCSNGGSKPIGAGSDATSPPGPASRYPKIDFQDLYYYSAPKSIGGPKSLDEIDPELLGTYAKLGIPLKEQEILAGVRKQGEKSTLDEDGDAVAAGRVAIDAVFDSVSVVTTFKDELAKAGVIFCSISEAIREHPELVKKYLGSVVPQGDNFYAALNSAVFSDGSFVYVPPNTRCPMELSTYFRINEQEHRPVRAHPDHRRQGRLCVLSRRLHRADAR